MCKQGDPRQGMSPLGGWYEPFATEFDCAVVDKSSLSPMSARMTQVQASSPRGGWNLLEEKKGPRGIDVDGTSKCLGAPA